MLRVYVVASYVCNVPLSHPPVGGHAASYICECSRCPRLLRAPTWRPRRASIATSPGSESPLHCWFQSLTHNSLEQINDYGDKQDNN